jgi:hypothetical protein
MIRFVGGQYDGRTIGHRDFEAVRVSPAASVVGEPKHFRHVLMPDSPADWAAMRDGRLKPRDIAFWRLFERHLFYGHVEYRCISSPITIVVVTDQAEGSDP